MSTACTVQKKPVFLFLLIGIVIAWVLVMTVSPPALRTPPEALPINSVYDLPLSNHAKEGHKNQAWNATSIQEYFKAGKCQPKKTLCQTGDPVNDYEVHYCQINPGKSIALVIGHVVRQVITGYMSDTVYWENKCQTPLP